MAIQAVGSFQMAYFGTGNQVQNLGILAITTLALHTISNLPMADAREAQKLEKEACEVSCSPLPGGKDDAPEKACQEVCKKGGVIIRVTEWTVDKANKILGEKVVKNISPAIDAWGDCAEKCSSVKYGVKAVGAAVEILPIEVLPGGGGVKEGVKVMATAVPEIVDMGCITACCAAKGAYALYKWFKP